MRHRPVAIVLIVLAFLVSTLALAATYEEAPSMRGFAEMADAVLEAKELPPLVDPWTPEGRLTPDDISKGRGMANCPDDGRTYLAQLAFKQPHDCSGIRIEKFTSGGGINVTIVTSLDGNRWAMTTLSSGLVAISSRSVADGAGSHLESLSSAGTMLADTTNGFDLYKTETPEHVEYRGIRTYHGMLASPPATCSAATIGWRYLDNDGFWYTCENASSPSWSS